MLFIFNLVLLTGTFSVTLCTEETLTTAPSASITTTPITPLTSTIDTSTLNSTIINATLSEQPESSAEALPEALPYIRNEMPLLIIRPVPGNHLPTAQQVNKNGGGFYISGPKGEDGEFPVKQFMSHFSDIIKRMNYHQKPSGGGGGGGGGDGGEVKHPKPIKPSYIPHNHNPNYHSGFGTSIIRFTPPPSHSSAVVVSPSNQHPKFIYSSDIHSIPSLNNLHAQQSHPVADVTRHHNHKSHQKPVPHKSSSSFPITNHGELSKFTANQFRASQPIPLIDDTDLPKSSLYGSTQQRYHPKNGGSGGGHNGNNKYHKDSHTSSSKFHSKKRPEKIFSFIELEDTDDDESSYENSWSSRPSTSSQHRYLNKKHSYNYSPSLHDLNQYQQQERISLYPETNPEYFQPNQNYQDSVNKQPKRSPSYQLKSRHTNFSPQTPQSPSPTTGTILVGSASATLPSSPVAASSGSSKKYVNYSSSVRVSDSSADNNNYRSTQPTKDTKHDLMYEKLYSSFIQRNLLNKKKQSVEILPFSDDHQLDNTKIKPVNEYHSEENIQPTYSSRYSNKDLKNDPNNFQSVYVSSSIRAQQDGPAIFITPIDFSTVSTITGEDDYEHRKESFVPSAHPSGPAPTASITVEDDEAVATTGTLDNPIESESTGIKSSTKHPFRKHTRVFRRKLNQSALMGESCETTCLDNIVSRAYDPVCGSDNKSYSNIGRLRCTKICGDHHLRISHFGNCDRTTNTLAIK